MASHSASGRAPALAALLPGRWQVRATNFPMWLSGGRTHPSIIYRLLSADPLVLADDVTWLTSEGLEKNISGTDRWRGNGFAWRGSGVMAILRSRWTVIGSSDDGNVVVTRFSKTVATPTGIDVITREGVEVDDPRAVVAGSAERFGLTAEEFASLAWLAAAE